MNKQAKGWETRRAKQEEALAAAEARGRAAMPGSVIANLQPSATKPTSELIREALDRIYGLSGDIQDRADGIATLPASPETKTVVNPGGFGGDVLCSLIAIEERLEGASAALKQFMG